MTYDAIFKSSTARVFGNPQPMPDRPVARKRKLGTTKLPALRAGERPHLVLYGPDTQFGATATKRHKKYVWVVRWSSGARRGEFSTRTSDREEAEAMLAAIVAEIPPSGFHPESKSVYRAWRRAVYRSRRDSIHCSLSLQDVISMYEMQGGKCAVTGISLDVANLRKADARSNAFGPSIDRIDCRGPYAIGNVRLVCVAANIAMNQWGESVLDEIACGYVRTKARARGRQGVRP